MPWKPALAGALLALMFSIIVEAARVTLGTNFHVVMPGRVYRCAQLSASALTNVVQANQIRTVVNLRGQSIPLSWYLEESRATHRLAVSQEDIALAANRLPSVSEIRRFVEVLDRTEYPILLHCRQGADRTGLASAIVCLLQPEWSLKEARRQLGPRYGHLPIAQAAWLDCFLDFYEKWLKQSRADHTPGTFRRWLSGPDCPGECCCHVEVLGPIPRPRAHEPAAIEVRICNTGLANWHFRRENNAGHHCVFMVNDNSWRPVASGRAGLFDAELEPGKSTELTLVVPPLRKAGHYRMLVDMADEQQGWFHQVGAEPLEIELDVHD